MIFAFGDHELDLERFELRRSGRAVTIQPKVFELLVHLVRHRDRSVTKEELLEAVWPDSVVTDGSLARAVSLARLAIGDRSDRPAVIVTVPRRGYAFRAPVVEVARPAAPLATGDGDPASRYVGRSALLARLGALVDDALGGRGRILFLAGEAGIGKTRTARILAEHAQRAGALVAAAWGLDGGAPSYWTWTRVLRALAGAAPGALAGVASAQRSALAHILPEFGDGDVGPSDAEGESLRFRLFEAAHAFLARVAASQPVALFLDDLHGADAGSIWLLESIGQELDALPIAIVVTWREDDAVRAPEHARALERLLRVTSLERWPLAGLREEEIRDFARAHLDAEPDAELVAALERKTGGNPLLLGESMRSLEARGLLREPRAGSAWESLLPSGIRHLLEPKLRRISPAALEVLGCAAAIGTELDGDLLARCLPDRPDLAARLEELRDAALLFSSNPPGALRFAHALVREALDAELVPSGDARRALHARIAAALAERSHAPSDRLAERAHHLCEAVPLVEAADACSVARAAAEQAARLHDFEHAAAWYGRALAVLDRVGLADPATRASLGIGLGAAQTRAIGLEPARESYRRSADHARSIARSDLLAGAALGFAHRPHSSGYGDREAIELLEEAARACAAADPATRIRLESRLAAEIRYTDRVRAEALADGAIAAARRLGDPAVLAQALDDACYVRWSPADPTSWVALNGEVVRAARAANDPELALEGHKGRVTGLLELGDLAAVDQEIRACERTAEALRTPYARWLCAAMRAMRALLDGDLVAAERRVADSIRIGSRVDSAEVALELQTQLVGLRLEQGRIAEIESAVRVQVERFPEAPAWRAALARILIATGRPAEAHEELVRLARQHFADVPRDRGWLPTLALASEVAAATADARTAEVLRQLLAPYAHLAVVAGTGVLYYGSVSHHLGLLAATCARGDAAIAHYEAALADEERAGARIWAARTRVACARALLGRDAPGDRPRAAGLAAEASATARSLALTAIAAEGRDLETAVWTRRRAPRARGDRRPRP